MSDYAPEIRRIIRAAQGESDGDVAMLEEAARMADVHADVQLGMEVRLRLISVANWSGNKELVLIAFTWCLAQLDRDPQIAQRFTRRVLWYYKWVIHSLSEYAEVSREQIAWSLQDMSDRFRRAGFGDGEVFKGNAHCAICLGDTAGFLEARERWLQSPRDQISDCLACRTNIAVEFDLHMGDLQRALETAEPIIQGRQRCKEVPCVTFARLLLPVLKLGSIELADTMHRASIRQTLSSRDMLNIAGYHCAYLACVGRMTKAIEVFEIAMPWLFAVKQTWMRMSFVEPASVLFQRLAERGDQAIQLRIPKSAPFHRDDNTYIPSTLAAGLEQMRGEFAAQFNRRNGNTNIDQQHEAFAQLVGAIRIPESATQTPPDPSRN